MNKRIRAYTIMELLVGMALSSLVISSAYYSYLTINNEFNRFRIVKSNLLELSDLNEQLEYDFEISDKVFFTNGVLRFDAENKKPITYEFIQPFIIREGGGSRDTFDLTFWDINVDFEGSLLSQDAIPEIVKSIDIKVSLFKKDCHLIYNKTYLPAEYIKMTLQQY